MVTTSCITGDGWSSGSYKRWKFGSIFLTSPSSPLCSSILLSPSSSSSVSFLQTPSLHHLTPPHQTLSLIPNRLLGAQQFSCIWWYHTGESQQVWYSLCWLGASYFIQASYSLGLPRVICASKYIAFLLTSGKPQNSRDNSQSCKMDVRTEVSFLEGRGKGTDVIWTIHT